MREKNILEDVKSCLPIESNDVVAFDDEILAYIGMASGTLNDAGFGNYILIDKDTKWSDFIPEETEISLVNMVRSYMVLQCKVLFDRLDYNNLQFYTDAMTRILYHIRTYDILKKKS